MKKDFLRTAFVFIVAFGLFFGALQAEASANRVFSLAGSGVYGYEDGSVSTAEFMQPAALAYDAKGRLFVADAAAQRIRLIADGKVETVAGGGQMSKNGMLVIGGYADGPGRSARFDNPEGIAVSSSGDVYVSDTGNHCIRFIHAGTVSTFAGSPTRPLAIDGARLTAAGFASPRQIAIEKDGHVLVADFGGGLRSIAPDGSVSSVRLPAGFDDRITGVATAGDFQGHEVVYVAGLSGLYGYDSVTGNKVALVSSNPNPAGFFKDGTFPLEQGVALGFPYALAAFSASEYLYTDLLSSSVSYVHVGAHQFLTAAPREGETADGTERLDAPGQNIVTPLAIAVSGTGTVAVADAGRKEIVRVEGPDRDGGVSAGDLQALQTQPNEYRVVVVGNSATWYGMSGNTSIAHFIGAYLRAKHVRIDGRVPHVIFTSRFDDQGTGFARNVLSKGFADMVLLFVNYENVDNLPPVKPTWKQDLGVTTRETVRALRAGNAKTVIVAHPLGEDLSPLDRPFTRFDILANGYERDRILNREDEIMSALRDVGAPVLDLWPDFRAEESSADGRPLYGTFDYHFSLFGRAYVGNLIARKLMQLEGWASK